MKTPLHIMILCSWFAASFLISGEVEGAINLFVETNPNPVQPGETIDVAITLGNSAAVSSASLILELTYPNSLASLDNDFVTGAGMCPGLECTAGEILAWNVGILQPGRATTVTLPAKVGGSVGDNTVIVFDVEVSDTAGVVAQASEEVVVMSEPAFDIAVDESVNPVAPEGMLSYAITYANRGSVSAFGSVLSFPLPPETTLQRASGAGALNAGAVEWDLGALSAGQIGREKVTISLDAGASAGEILVVESAAISGTVSSVPHSSSAMSGTRIEEGVPLAVAVEMNPDPVQPGETIQTALSVSNIGESPLSGVTLQMRRVGNLNNFDIDKITGDGSCPFPDCQLNELIDWDLGTLQPGVGVSVTLPPRVFGTPPDGTAISFMAMAKEDGGREAMGARTVVVDSAPPFDILVEENFDPISPGSSQTIWIDYSNRSDETSYETVLSFALPAGMSFQSASGNGTLSGNAVEWGLQAMPPFSAGRQQVSVSVGEGVSPGSLMAADATVEGTVASLNRFSTGAAVARVEKDVPLGLTLETNPNPVKPDEIIQTSLTVSNLTDEALYGVVLQLRTPESLRDLDTGYITGGGSCPFPNCDANELATWDLGILPVGGGVTVSMPPVVFPSTADGEIIAFVADAKEDMGRAARVRRGTTVLSEPVFDIAAVEDKDPVAPGNTLTYVIEYANRSADSAFDVSLAFPLPEGTEFLYATGDAIVAFGIVEWDLGTLPSKLGGIRRVTVSVDAGIASGTVLEVHSASIRGELDFAEHVSFASVSTRTADEVPLSLSVDFMPNPALPFDFLTGDLHVSNTGAGDLFGVVLQLRYPQSLTDYDDGLLTDGGTCGPPVCAAGELISWGLGTVQSGAETVVDLTPRVSSDASEGDLILFDAMVGDDQGNQVSERETVLVGMLGEQPPPVGIYVEESQNCGGHFPCEPDVQAGIGHQAADGAVIEVAVGNYADSVTLDSSKTAMLECGWNSNFDSRQADRECEIGGPNGTATKIGPSLTIGKGTIILE